METTSKTPGCHDETLTEKEIAVLKAIRDDEYRDGDLTQAVWSHNIDVPTGMTRRGMGGVFKSLREKGYVALDGTGKDSTVALLQPAIAFLTAPAPVAKPTPTQWTTPTTGAKPDEAGVHLAGPYSSGRGPIGDGADSGTRLVPVL